MEHFEIIERIGRGAESTVYKVKLTFSSHNFPSIHAIQQDYYALKYIPVTSVEQFNDALLEAQIAIQLHHPHIVPCLEFFVTHKPNFSTTQKKKSKKTSTDVDTVQWSVCLVSEFCSKGTLKQFIQKLISAKKTIPEFLFWKWLKQILKALSYMHSDCDLIHRDVKPENIFLDEQMNVKLGDLGFTKKFINNTQTSHSILGTHHFLAPELRGNFSSESLPYTNALDIWCLGCVAMELITLKRFDFAFELVKNSNTFFQQIPSNYSPQLVQFVQSMLRIDPLERPSASTLLEKLDAMEPLPEPTDWQQFPFGKPPKTVADLLLDLDRDCYHIIFSFLHFKDVIQCSVVCKDWYASVLSANFVWKLFLQREIGTPIVSNSNCKQEFQYQYCLDQRWKKEICNRKVFPTISNEAMLGLKLFTNQKDFSTLLDTTNQVETNGFVVAACETGNIRIFHLYNQSCLKLLHSFEQSHVGPVWASDYNHQQIIASAGFDKKIVLWDIVQKKKRFEFVNAHTKEIWDMNFIDECTLVSGSGAKNVSIHDIIVQKELLTIANVSKGSIYATKGDAWKIYPQCIAAGGLCGKCKLFDIRQSSAPVLFFDSFDHCSEERKKQSNSVYEIEWKGHTLLTGNAEGNIDGWDLRFIKQPAMHWSTNLTAHSGCIRGLHYDGGYKIVTGSAHGQVHLTCIKDSSSPTLVHTFFKTCSDSKQVKSAWAMSLTANETHMVTSTHVGELTVYDFTRKNAMISQQQQQSNCNLQ